MFACVWWSSVEFGTAMSPKIRPGLKSPGM
jgi:hypothetical protein